MKAIACPELWFANKWLEFWLDDKWWGFMAESKQKCLNRIVGDTRIGEFWFREKWSGIYFFSTWKAKNLSFLSINAVSPKIGKRRIGATLWRSPVLQILQTENLKRKNTRVFRVFSIHKPLYINELKQKWWGIYNQIRTHSPFCKCLIIKHSQVTHKLQMVIHSFSELHSPRLRWHADWSDRTEKGSTRIFVI